MVVGGVVTDLIEVNCPKVYLRGVKHERHRGFSPPFSLAVYFWLIG